MTATIEAFFDPATFTYSYVVADPATAKAAVIDSVLDYDPAAGRLATESMDQIIDYVERNSLSVEWVLDTHIHADHLSASQYLKARLGGRTAIGKRVSEVQEIFAGRFNADETFACDGRQFDRLFTESEIFQVGKVQATVLATPGHTPACVTYVFDGFAFVGDTLFMPDYGTARTDFPGGDAATLYRSIRKILALPADTQLYMCHDYGTAQRPEFRHLTSVAEERAHNVQIHDGVSESKFVADRESRDAKLAAPKLLLPSVQFNMRGGALPPAEDNGIRYFKIPVTEV